MAWRSRSGPRAGLVPVIGTILPRTGIGLAGHPSGPCRRTWTPETARRDRAGYRARVTGRPPHASQVPYAGLGLDRAPGRRDDPGWVASLAASPRATAWPLWRDQVLVHGDPAVPAVRPPAALDGGDPARLVLLGLDDGAGVFAADLSGLSLPDALAEAGADAAADTRSLFGRLPAGQAATLAYARGLLYWHRQQRYCGRCGAATEPRQAGQARACAGRECGVLLFPRLEPAVITLVETVPAPGRCLLARHRASKTGRYSLLAGFAEIGESLEDAVRREIGEEVGLRLDQVRYAGSQPWPFPAGIMVGFRAITTDEAVSADGDEIQEARWFTRAELRDYAAATGWLGRADSIDRIMLTAWLAEGAEP